MALDFKKRCEDIDIEGIELFPKASQADLGSCTDFNHQSGRLCSDHASIFRHGLIR
jgi:hypothetical protein